MAAGFASGSASQTMHSAGIYADMTLDGPEIGTLVVVLDRAKNLPNRKTMGKQNPYCAARLGKEAKKTSTDIRGGQTPKWDQELRFTVHDSPDYNTLKLSMFNDDKKTDLIGETLIDLTEVLRPGGGQSDQWHGLNWKGRYAGEIRIELTYYDSRPKTERPRDRKQSVANAPERSSSPSLAGSRSQPTSVRRRPLPGDPSIAQPITPEPNGPSMPIPITGPRSYHSPPQIDADIEGRSQSCNSSHYNSFSTSFRGQREISRRALPDPAMSQLSDRGYDNSMLSNGYAGPSMIQNQSIVASHHGFHDDGDVNADTMDNYIPVTDDPYALQAVDAYQEEERRDSFTPLAQPQPRHARVQALSGSHGRPPPEIPLTHTHSAPPFTSPHQTDSISYDDPQNYPQSESSQAISAHVGTEATLYSEYLANIEHNNHTYSQANQSRPPPPPAHRYSAPSVTRDIGSSSPMHQIQQLPRRGPNQMHDPSRRHDGEEAHPELYPDNRAPRRLAAQGPNYDTPSGPGEHRRQSANEPHHEYHNSFAIKPTNRGGDPTSQQRVRERASMSTIDSQVIHGHTRQAGHLAGQQQQMPYEVPMGYGSYEAVPRRSLGHRPTASFPMIRPRPISPNRQALSTPQARTPQPQAPQSVSPYVDSQRATSAVPYSPDSFSVFNPRLSKPTTPTAASAPGTPQQVSPMNGMQGSPNVLSSLVSPAAMVSRDSPIIGSDGRVKDPSDHLPPSSYAPEPERKGNRPSTVVTIKNRFGPRQAPPIPVVTRQPRSATASPLLAQDDRRGSGPHQQQLRQTQPLTSRPLAPTQQAVLNTQQPRHNSLPTQQQAYGGASGYGYDRVEMFAPPVPRKIPLDAYEDGRSSPGSTTQLAMNLGSMNLNSPQSISPSDGPPARVRRSRWGA